MLPQKTILKKSWRVLNKLEFYYKKRPIEIISIGLFFIGLKIVF